jgi:hypothetical protein
MTAICLSPEETRDITGKRRVAAQSRALSSMGIPFRVRFDGSLMVLRNDVLAPAPGDRTTEPNWSAIGGKSAA